MIIELNGNREGKPLCHVAMVVKFLVLNTTVFLQIWQEKQKKLTCMTFLCMIALPHGNQTKR